MTHENSGHYALKHPPGTVPDPDIAERLREKAKDNCISCAAAHKIAEDTGRTPSEIGKNIDLLELRISKCQMGLFGYTPQKRRVKPAESVSPELEAALKAAVRDNRIPCIACWQLAEQFGISRPDIANACEKLGIKSSPCQLGAF